ncbi:16S rRNA (cytidine(1402)-2'-O)-methyltransferase [Spongiibacter sp. IMCC21906]|uniref:16S rRNA (cytidine(1402)-2'-O)-methyltransferase n=1 Tax=Spongiibacter sp. IMCC21906 TaxID=1620392 RepID=UPI00062E0912|nr:16S rRNA (cytidine(1402)-2'-O)-methyltransferase [Spongiibacter sp. IMCC21906]
MGLSTPSLFVVATPIGNLGDMVPRAIEVLQSVSLVAAEDTRHSRQLLKHFDISVRLQAYHDHSNDADLDGVLAILRGGGSVALVSDAGTPLISDPGYRLVDAALSEGFAVVPIPGPCAMVAALSVSGLPSNRFIFEGFLAAKQHGRLQQLQALQREPRTLLFYEAPHRLLASLQDMQEVFGGERRVTLARELTKLFETVKRLPLAELCEWVAADSNQQRGECVLVVEGYAGDGQKISAEALQALTVLTEELPLKQAAALAAKISGAKKNALYKYALENLQ